MAVLLVKRAVCIGLSAVLKQTVDPMTSSNAEVEDVEKPPSPAMLLLSVLVLLLLLFETLADENKAGVIC